MELDMSIYVVKQGDTVNQIARDTDTSVDTIIFDNQLLAPYTLAIGQALFINDGTPTKEIEFRVNGYAYPFIQRSVLQETLYYLTSLSIFSYGFTVTGELNPLQLDDTWMIQAARTARAIPILTLTPLENDSTFNSYLVTSVVNNENYRDNLIQNILQKVEEKNYGGVDIDFEYIEEYDRDAFTNFVNELRIVMNENGYEVSIALAPKISDDQKGLLYEGLDYEALGNAANRVLLMTYEYGYKYGPNMAIAPINQVRRVVEYAVTKIPRWKINLGIPNYAYDWPLPFRKGITEAATISNVQAVRNAVKYGAVIQYDELAQAPYYNYELNGVEHEVWFEDVRSIQAKIDLVKEFELEGVGYWQINSLFRANWILLDSQVRIEKQ